MRGAERRSKRSEDVGSRQKGEEGRGKMPKSTIDLCRLIGPDAGELVCITTEQLDERIKQSCVAQVCV